MYRQLLAASLFLALTLPGHAFQFQDDQTSGIMTITDGTSNVLSLNYGQQLAAGVDPKYSRSSYIHPVWAADGTVLTDDFPTDHPHHHGVFWGWPNVTVRGQDTENWHPDTPPLRHAFSRWITRTAGETSATVVFENHWRLDEKLNVAKETVAIQIHRADGASRAIDFAITIEALEEPITLQGSQQNNKGYGGFCFRSAPLLKGARITTATGSTSKDIVGQQTPWARLAKGDHGVAVFAHPDHPNHPPHWMVRNSYTGFMNVSWPGLSPINLAPEKPVTLKYRLFIHEGDATAESLQAAYETYANSTQR